MDENIILEQKYHCVPYGQYAYQYGMIGILVGFRIESLVSLVLVRHYLSSDSDLVSEVFSLTYKEISFIN